MKKEKNNIDDLFRRKMSERIVPSDPAAWSEMEELLDRENSRSRGGLWFMILLLALGMVGSLWFYYSSSNDADALKMAATVADKNQEGLKPSSLENPQVENNLNSSFSKDDSLPHQPAQSKATENFTRTNVDKGIVDEHFDRQTSQSRLEDEFELIDSGRSRTHNESSKGDKMASNILVKDEALEHSKSSTTNNPSNSETSSDESFVVISSHELSDDVGTITPNKEADQQDVFVDAPQEHVVSNEENLLDEIGEVSSTDPSKDERESQNPVVPAEVIPPPTELPSTNTPSKRFRIEASMYTAYTTSSFNKDVPSLLRRDEQEKGTMTRGFDLNFFNGFGNLNVGLGLSYINSGENISYTPERKDQWQVDTTYWNVEDMGYYDVDTTFDNGFLIIDSVYVEDWDSTLVQGSTTHEGYISDDAIAGQNGRSSITIISLPIRFGWQVNLEKSFLYFSGSVEPAWIVGRRALYLNDDESALSDVNDIPSYRSMTWYTSLGIAWNRKILAGKAYYSINPMMRMNIASWNREYRHTYFDVGLRLGIGYFIGI